MKILNFPFPLIPTDRDGFDKMMSAISSNDQTWRTWRILANKSEGDKMLNTGSSTLLSLLGLLYLNVANSVLMILFCMNADYILLVSRETVRTEAMSQMRMIKCGADCEGNQLSSLTVL